jgi:hypothetical protein
LVGRWEYLLTIETDNIYSRSVTIIIIRIIIIVIIVITIIIVDEWQI